jgi:cytochrome P450
MVINLASKAFINAPEQFYDRARREHPVAPARIGPFKFMALWRFEDCQALLKHPGISRNRGTALGKAPTDLPFALPLPKRLKPLVKSMITEDDPNHRRLRNLVRGQFTPQAINTLRGALEHHAQRLLAETREGEPFEVQSALSLPLSTHAIATMLGVDDAVMPELKRALNTVSSGFSLWRIGALLFRDLPKSAAFLEGVIAAKRQHPGADLLSGLLMPTEGEAPLSDEEALAMTFLLLIAGFETTTHLVSNGTHALIHHPKALAALREDPNLWPEAIDEILRLYGPIHSTKPNFAAEPITLRGVTIPRGTPIMPMLGCANRDPDAFEAPEEFRIHRPHRHHLAFGYGPHYCLGAHLAKLEAEVALRALFQRYPRLALSEAYGPPQRATLPGWSRYQALWVDAGAPSRPQNKVLE